MQRLERWRIETIRLARADHANGLSPHFMDRARSSQCILHVCAKRRRGWRRVRRDDKISRFLLDALAAPATLRTACRCTRKETNAFSPESFTPLRSRHFTLLLSACNNLFFNAWCSLRKPRSPQRTLPSDPTSANDPRTPPNTIHHDP